ncbi:hypothetical protein PPL_03046 [Heterostelium album PN500]|uniref:Uncharacterized protein n=1 Tax=Heterostelium pallidum (strain ATCC 26659 / Pp 5 / PN500) TaxID=670386 RepID=D3B3S5_HETP5|nr:hypothetical protein PPL_03046 [Heterostelium album PN500]EFA83973.1 hypothetical protein PPL_03046 [Heterostelium album PN500]|eukprot:XP_020436090.1 hypothetical protein PPL_03046 [Heterostelium album PN500]
MIITVNSNNRCSTKSQNYVYILFISILLLVSSCSVEATFNETECKTLQGDGTQQVTAEMFNFTISSQIVLSNMDTSGDQFFIYKLPSSASKLSCDHCNIQTLETTTLHFRGVRTLSILNNPISGKIYTSSVGSVSDLDYRAFDTSFIRELYWVLNMGINNVLPLSIKGYISGLPDGTTLTTTNFYSLNFQLGLNFNQSSFENLRTISTIATLILNDTKVQPNVQIDFPFADVHPTINTIQLYNLDLVAPTAYFNLSTMKSLMQFTISNSPNYNINGEIPFSAFGQSLTYIILSGIGITKPLSPNVPISNTLNIFTLSKNLLAGTPPIYPQANLLDYSNNKFSGLIPKEYCHYNFNLSYNLMTGELPTCVTCHLYSKLVKSMIVGNQFSNYRDNWTPSQYPPCTTIKIQTALLYDKSTLTIYGTDIGWENAFATKSPKTTIINEVPNERLGGPIWSMLYVDRYINVSFPSANNISISAPLTLQGAQISNISVYTAGNYGISFFMLGRGFGDNTSRIAMALGHYRCEVEQALSAAAGCTVYDVNIPDDTYIFQITILTPANTIITTNYTYIYRRSNASTTCPSKGGNTSVKFDAECASTNINAIGSNTLNYLTIEKNGKTLQGRFIDRMLSDGRPTFITTEIVKQTENEVMKFYIKFTKSGILIVKKASQEDDDPNSTSKLERINA